MERERLNPSELVEAKADAAIVAAEHRERLNARVTHEELGELMTRLSYATASPQNNLTSKDIQLKMAVYADGLNDLPAEVLRAAVLQCIKTEKWFPAVAVIREAAEETWGSLMRTCHCAEGVVVEIDRLTAHRNRP